MNPAVDPAHIAVSRAKGIRVEWKDGSVSEFPLQYLRDHCPCAGCTGAHGTTPAKQSNESPFQVYKATLRIDRVDPVGSYAIKIRWNDGHDTGLYTWEYLRSISLE